MQLTNIHAPKPSAPLFNNRMSAFYSDTSFAKFTTQKAKQQSDCNSLPQKLSELHSQSLLAAHASLNYSTEEKWQSIKRNAIKSHLNAKNSFEKAAITIQRVVRGHLCRIKIEEFIVQTRELRTNFLLQETEKISNLCLFHFGLIAEAAAIKLQRAVKRFLVRLRFLSLIKCYNAYLDEKSKNASNKVRSFCQIQICKQKLADLTFLIYKGKKLREIRENLAFISLKKFWRKRKLSFRIIKDKLLRLKRKRTALANKEAYQKMLTSAGKSGKSPLMKSLTKTTTVDYENEDGEAPAEVVAVENQEVVKEENEEEAQKRILEENAQQEKLLNSKLAYGLYDIRNVIIIPFLQERELNETVSNSLEVHLFENTASIYNKSNAAHRTQLPKIRNTIITSSPQAHHKRLSIGDSSLPPLLLLSSNYTSKANPRPLPREISHAPFMSEEKTCKHRNQEVVSLKPKRRNLHSENRFLQDSTVSNLLKKSEKKILSTLRKWSLGNRNAEYTPGLDNSSYTPKRWQPIKLDRSILETGTSTQYVRSHHRVGSNPTSFISFSSGIMVRNTRQSIEQISLSPSHGEASMDRIPYDFA